MPRPAAAIRGTPIFQAGSFDAASRARDARLAAGSPGIDGGVPIPNFNDNVGGNAPDCGAIEYGAPNPVVGVGLWRPSGDVSGAPQR